MGAAIAVIEARRTSEGRTDFLLAWWRPAEWWNSLDTVRARWMDHARHEFVLGHLPGRPLGEEGHRAFLEGAAFDDYLRFVVGLDQEGSKSLRDQV
jgi:hypothetical protein